MHPRAASRALKRIQKDARVSPERRAQAEAELKKIPRANVRGYFEWLGKYWDIIDEKMVNDPWGYGLKVQWALVEYRRDCGDDVDTTMLEEVTALAVKHYGALA